jgi:hypothetical protein
VELQTSDKVAINQTVYGTTAARSQPPSRTITVLILTGFAIVTPSIMSTPGGGFFT